MVLGLKYTATIVLAALLALVAYMPIHSAAQDVSTLPIEKPKYLIVVRGPFQEGSYTTYCNGVPVSVKVVYERDGFTMIVKPADRTGNETGVDIARIAACVIDGLLSSGGHVTIQEGGTVTTPFIQTTTTATMEGGATSGESLTGASATHTGHPIPSEDRSAFRLAVVLAAGVLGSAAAWLLARW